MSEPRKADLYDHWSLLKMDVLTMVGKSLLPKGQWKGHTPGENAQTPRLYLTFDDGPNPKTTPALIEILAENNIAATFFLVGSNVEKYPHLVEALQKAGHAIGNHTFTHPMLPALSTAQIEKEVGNTNHAIEQITEKTPVLFRAPCGVLDKRASQCLTERSMQLVHWGAVSEDWLPLGSHRVVARTQRRFEDGAILVLHEGWFPKQTIEATKEVIEHGKHLGFDFAPISEH